MNIGSQPQFGLALPESFPQLPGLPSGILPGLPHAKPNNEKPEPSVAKKKELQKKEQKDKRTWNEMDSALLGDSNDMFDMFKNGEDAGETSSASQALQETPLNNSMGADIYFSPLQEESGEEGGGQDEIFFLIDLEPANLSPEASGALQKYGSLFQSGALFPALLSVIFLNAHLNASRRLNRMA